MQRGDWLRWLTREEELKWQQLMRHSGTRSARRLCCSCDNFSKQHADSMKKIQWHRQSSRHLFLHALHPHAQNKLKNSPPHILNLVNNYSCSVTKNKIDCMQSGDTDIKMLCEKSTVSFLLHGQTFIFQTLRLFVPP